MKLNMRTLIVLIFLYSVSRFYGQSNIIARAPSSNANSQTVGPAGTSVHANVRACYLITAAELSALTGSVVTDFGFHFIYGTISAPVTGSINIYLQNTNDVSYSKGTGFSSLLTGMTSVFNGNMTVPANTGTSNVLMTLPTSFTYTGGGLYVAFDWSSAGPFASSMAYYDANISSQNMGVFKSSSGGTLTLATLNSTTDRPVMLFGAINTATNEAGVRSIDAPGKVAEATHEPHVITANITNLSINPLSNLTVSLNISGANTFSDTQTITSISPGAAATVSFAPFAPATLGLNTVVVTLPSDQNSQNNQKSWTQSVTCNITSNTPPNQPYTNSAGYGGGDLTSLFRFNTTVTLTAVRIALSSDPGTPGTALAGVLLDDTGTPIDFTPLMGINNSMLNTIQTFEFDTPWTLSANTDYYIGLAQPSTASFPMSIIQDHEGIADSKFYSIPLNGGTPTRRAQGYYAIDPVLASAGVTITQPDTVICAGESITLTGHGASTYSWSGSSGPIATPHSSSVVVSPASNTHYTLNARDAAGCIASVDTKVDIDLCTGVRLNNGTQATVKLFPNPAPQGMFTISGLEGPVTVTVYNILGEVVLTKRADTETVYVELPGRPAGTYVVKLTASGQQPKTIKFVTGQE